jgi:CheY-like chemotaxis protein
MLIPNLENKRILIVEDDDMSFLYLNQVFLLTRAQVTRHTSGRDAVEAFKSDGKFDLILMDIQLPDMNGRDATREIRKLDKSVPVIAQTASRSEDEKDLILNSGCSEAMIKPFTMDELFAVVSRYIAS